MAQRGSGLPHTKTSFTDQEDLDGYVEKVRQGLDVAVLIPCYNEAVIKKRISI